MAAHHLARLSLTTGQLRWMIQWRFSSSLIAEGFEVGQAELQLVRRNPRQNQVSGAAAKQPLRIAGSRHTNLDPGLLRVLPAAGRAKRPLHHRRRVKGGSAPRGHPRRGRAETAAESGSVWSASLSHSAEPTHNSFQNFLGDGRLAGFVVISRGERLGGAPWRLSLALFIGLSSGLPVFTGGRLLQ